MLDSVSGFVGSSTDSVLFVAIAIALCAVFFEDVTTIVTGLLVADGLVPIPIACVALYLGVCVGDMMLYTLGVFARTHPRLTRYIDHDFTAPLRFWLGNKYAFTVLSGHFVPGLRFTTYVASGFFRMPLTTYVPMALLSGLLFLTIFFPIAYWFGSVTTGWMSYTRWGIALVLIVILLVIGRQNIRAYRAGKNVMHAPLV